MSASTDERLSAIRVVEDELSFLDGLIARFRAENFIEVDGSVFWREADPGKRQELEREYAALYRERGALTMRLQEVSGAES